MSEKNVMEVIGEILCKIGDRSNRRSKPRNGDLEGDYDAWFDGGAVKYITGSTEYYFQDGSKAMVGVLPYLSVYIELADGSKITVSEDKPFY